MWEHQGGQQRVAVVRVAMIVFARPHLHMPLSFAPSGTNIIGVSISSITFHQTLSSWQYGSPSPAIVAMTRWYCWMLVASLRIAVRRRYNSRGARAGGVYLLLLMRRWRYTLMALKLVEDLAR